MLANHEASLERWMRQYYFDTDIDIGSSGVECFSLAEVRELCGIDQAELDALVFDDSRTLGDPQLRATIARRWGDGNPDKVMATNGSSEANYLIMNALLAAGDEVIVIDPLYQQLYGIAAAIGCRLQPWRLRAEHHFVPDVDELVSLLSPRTRMVVVNFPHNPTGASLTLEQQQKLVAAVAAVGAYLVWDAAFDELTYDTFPLPQPNLRYERSISLGTLSKAFGLPGLRVGWCFAQPEVLEKCVRLRDYISLYLSPLVELIARRAIEHSDVLVGIRRTQARTNLDLLAAWMEEHRGLIEWSRPQGGVCAFPRLLQVADVVAFCRQLAISQRVLLVPGTCFNRAQHVRLGFGGSTTDLREGLERLSAQLESNAYLGVPPAQTMSLWR